MFISQVLFEILHFSLFEVNEQLFNFLECTHCKLDNDWMRKIQQTLMGQHQLVVSNNVPVKSKLQHPPSQAYPGRLTPFPALPGRNLITTHRGWGIWSLVSISCYESRWFHMDSMAETAETNFDEFKRKDCVLVADWLKNKGLHKLCSVFEGA